MKIIGRPGNRRGNVGGQVAGKVVGLRREIKVLADIININAP
jgi:hypothetical protein